MIEIKNCSVLLKDTKLISEVSFFVSPQAFFCLIGESGGGKTLLTKAIMNLLPQNLKRQGNVILASEKIDLIMQDPRGGLQTTIKIGRQLNDLLKSKKDYSAEKRKEKIVEILSWVGLDQPLKIMQQYPYQLSGGMCQKVAIAAALLMEPEILVADEPTSALDEASQNSILELLQRIRIEKKLTIFFVTHDLSIIKKYATDIGVVQQGKVIEVGPKDSVLNSPQEPYTKELIAIFERYSTAFKRSSAKEEISETSTI